MTTKITGWSVTSSSCSGVRIVLIRLRPASASAVPDEPERPPAGRPVACAVVVPAVMPRSSVLVVAPASRRPRAVRPVSVKNTSSRLGRRSDSSVTPMPASSSRRTAAVNAASPSTGTVSTPRLDVSGSCAGHRPQDRRGVREPRRVGRPYGERLAADDPLELRRRAVRDHPAVVDHRDLVGERVGLLQVLRGEQHRRPVVDQRPDDAPHVLALGRVQAGRRLVQVDHVGPADQARGQVEAAAHAAGVGLGRPVGGLGEVEPGEQLGARAAWRRAGAGRAAAPMSTRFCGAGQVLVDRGVLAGQPDQAAHPGGVADHVVGRRPSRGRRRAAAAWRGCGRRWSCRRRWGRARRARCPAGRRGRSRPARWSPRSA